METSPDHHDLSKIIKTALTSHLLQHLWVSSIRSQELVYALPPSQRESLPCCRPSSWSLVPAIWKAGLMSKSRGAEFMVSFIFSMTFCKGSHSHSAAGNIFFSLPFAATVPVAALLFALHVLCQIQLPVGFGFPNLIPANLDSVCIPPGLLDSCFPSLVHFHLMLEFCQETLVHSCKASYHLCLARQDGPF